MNRVACPWKSRVHFSLLPLLSASPSGKSFHLAACEGEGSTRLLLVWETMLQSTVFVLPIGGLWALGKKLHGRTWENLCGSSCVGTLTCWKVLVTVERESIAEDLLRLTGCSTSPFNRALLSSDGKQQAVAGFGRQLQTAGLCACSPHHLLICTATARSLLSAFGWGEGTHPNVLWQQKLFVGKFWKLKNAP